MEHWLFLCFQTHHYLFVRCSLLVHRICWGPVSVGDHLTLFPPIIVGEDHSRLSPEVAGMEIHIQVLVSAVVRLLSSLFLSFSNQT